MLVSCQCITFGRPDLIEEAIESFHRQTTDCEKELVILNDHPEQQLVYEHPEVAVINVPRRFATVGEKRNACVALCRGDVIFPWDDDDISFPWRISLSLERMGEGSYFKPTAAWLWSSGKIRGLRRNVYHAMGAWRRTLFQQVGGYPHIQSGQDAGIEDRFRDSGQREVTELSAAETYYVYRFGGTGHPHLSGYGYDRGWQELGRRDVKAKGRIELRSQWAADYTKMVLEAQSRSASN